MNKTDVCDRWLETLNATFPQNVAALEPIPGDKDSTQAVLYGVPLVEVEGTEDRLFELSRTMNKSDASLLPMVVDIEDTSEYYPEIMVQVLARQQNYVMMQIMVDLLTKTPDDLQRYVDMEIQPMQQDNQIAADVGLLALAA